MDNIFLCCTLLCLVFLCLNIFKVGLKGKSILLPSTIFAFMWMMTSLGIFLVSFNLIDNNFPMKMSPTLIKIGEYQFNILLICFCAFICARIKMLGHPFFRLEQLAHSYEVGYIVKHFRWILYLFCFLGLLRLYIVVSTVGFDMSAMRQYYLDSRKNFSALDINLIRYSQYVLQLAVFYVCILGVNAAIRGINLRKILIDFLLFMPYQFSFGGRLYILSFFVPFLVSYMAIRLVSFKSFIRDRKAIKRLAILIILPLSLIVIMQALKLNRTSGDLSREKNVSELFYTSTSYIHMVSLWKELPSEDRLSLGFGRNISPWLTSESPIYTDIMQKWQRHWNPAVVSVPSMIPGMYLDFGTVGSYIIYFIIFYYIELIAMKSMIRFSFRKFVVYILMCMFAFNTATSSMSDNFRLTFVGLLFIYLFTRFVRLPKKNAYEITKA